jgi:hypothetical protein
MDKEKLDAMWETWYQNPKCPKCGSDNIKSTNEFKGHYRRANPLGLRNKQKHICNECKHEWWESI